MNTIITALIASVLFFSCQPSVDKKELKKEILAIHQDLIKAHLKNNPEFFTNNLSYNFVSVKNGDILRPGKQEMQANVNDYITNTTFTEYKDLQDPIIDISDDGSVAWAIVKVLVQGERKLTDGTKRKINFTCAWLTLYRKTGAAWLAEAEVSTFK